MRMKAGEHSGAMEDLSLALHHKPRDAKAWMRRAAALEAESFFHAAAAAAERVLLLDGCSGAEARKLLARLQREAAAQGPLPRILALCGSHIATAARLAYLPQMVGSWYIQWHAVPLHISLSCAAELREAVEGVVSGLLHLHPGLTISLRPAPLSQGQHYERLVRRLQREPGCDAQRTWLLLTDDDDIWHPRRTLVYAAALQALTGGHLGMLPPARVLSVCSALYIDAAEAQAVASPFCVQRLHASGAAPVKNMLKNGADPAQALLGEAWCYSMRLCTLAQFFAALDPCLLAHVYWDQCLGKYLRWGNPYQTCWLDQSLLDDNWCYYYRRDEATAPASRLLASQLPSFSANPLLSVAATVRANLEVYCSQRAEFDAAQFADWCVANTPTPQLKPVVAGMAPGLAELFLADPGSVYSKLLSSPLCLQSDHA